MRRRRLKRVENTQTLSGIQNDPYIKIQLSERGTNHDISLKKWHQIELNKDSLDDSKSTNKMFIRERGVETDANSK